MSDDSDKLYEEYNDIYKPGALMNEKGKPDIIFEIEKLTNDNDEVWCFYHRKYADGTQSNIMCQPLLSYIFKTYDIIDPKEGQ